MRLTLPPCWASGTSIADPITCTESICGAISNRTVCVGGTGIPACVGCPPSNMMAWVRNPGAVTTSFTPGASSYFTSKTPPAEVVTCATTPTRLTTDTCASSMDAPDGSTTLPFTEAAERQAEQNKQQAAKPETVFRIQRLLPRE